MKIFSWGKDGGEESTVWGFWLVEIKRWFSVAVLCFENGSREAYHEHAFNCVSWVLSGSLKEETLEGPQSQYLGERKTRGVTRWLSPSWRPFITRRATFHKVTSEGRSWVLTFRGPWVDRWREYLPLEGRFATLTHGRAEVG